MRYRVRIKNDSDEWFSFGRLVTEICTWCEGQNFTNMDLIAGPGTDEIDFMFGNKEEALLFRLKFGGEYIEEEKEGTKPLRGDEKTIS